MSYHEILRGNIAAELARAGWSRTDVAELLGIKPNSFSAKMYGRNEFKFGEIILIAGALGISLQRLIEGIEEAEELKHSPTKAVSPA